jgi:ABC-type Mn2+/Zn2+ transport system permease subunit
MDGFITILLSVVVLVATFILSKKLLISIVSEEMAETSGVNVHRTNLLYMLLVGLIVSLGIKFVGTLLMGALVIIPAVAAKNLTRNIYSYFLVSVIFGVASAISGIIIAAKSGFSVGATVVCISVVLYIFTYIVKKILNI